MRLSRRVLAEEWRRRCEECVRVARHVGDGHEGIQVPWVEWAGVVVVVGLDGVLEDVHLGVSTR